MPEPIEVKLKLKSSLAEQTQADVAKFKTHMAAAQSSAQGLGEAIKSHYSENTKWINLEAAAAKKRDDAYQKWLGKIDQARASTEKLRETSTASAASITSGFENMTNNVGSKLTGMIANVAMAWVSFQGVMKIKSMIADSIQYGATITDMARKLGLSTNEYQKLDYVAKQSGTSIGYLQRAFTTMSKEAMQSSQILGVSTHDSNGHIKEQGQLFEELLIRISEIPNKTERMAASMKVFGMAGKEVFSIASKGKDSIRELIGETETYGLILDTLSIKKLHDAEEAQNRLNISWKVAVAQLMIPFADILTNKILPPLTKYAKILAESLKTPEENEKEIQIRKLTILITQMGGAMFGAEIEKKKLFDFQGIIYSSKDAKKYIAELNKEIDTLKGVEPTTSAGSQFDDLMGKGKKTEKVSYNPEEAMTRTTHLAVSTAVYGTELSLNAQAAGKLQTLAAFYDFTAGLQKKDVQNTIENVKKKEGVLREFEKMKISFESPREKIQREAGEELSTVGAAAGAGIITPAQAAAMEIKIEQKKNIGLKKLDDDAHKAKMKNIADQVSLYAGMASKVVSIAENMAQAQINTIEAHKQAETDAVEHSHMSAKAKQKALEKIDKEAQEKERAVKKQQQDWAVASALVSGAVAVMKDLSDYGWVVGGIMGVLDLAVMASEIAAIKSQKFATGLEAGPVRQVTGTGGTDSQAIRATPGEVVATPSQLLALSRGSSTTSNATTHHYHMGDIVIQGSAGPAAIQQIRRTQQQQIRDLRDLMRAGQRMRQLA
jgi:hypothetical protein